MGHAGDNTKLTIGRALALLMFGERPVVLDRVAALAYLRTHGLPEATLADLDTACAGLETPWARPEQQPS